MSSAAPPSRPAVPLLGTLLLAALAGAGAATAVSMLHEPPGARTAGLVVATATDDVLARLDGIERRLARAEPAVSVPVSAAPDRQPSDGAPDDVARRLAVLQRQVEELVARRAERDVAGAPQTPDPQAEQRRIEVDKRIAAQQAVILDPRSDDKQKLAAWSQLRQLKDSWNDGVVATMTHLGLTATDPLVRADVWRQADGRSTHPAMASALLQALTADAHAKTREEAAETLANYMSVAGVRQALELASTNDADAGVRRQALDSLASRR